MSTPHPSPSLLSPSSQQGLQTQAGNTPAVWPGSTGVSPRRGRKGREKERWPWVGLTGATASGRIEERTRRSEKPAPLCSEIPEHGLGSPTGLEPVSPRGQKSTRVTVYLGTAPPPPPIRQGGLRTDGEVEARGPGKALTSGPWSWFPSSPRWSSGKQAIFKLHAHLLWVPSLTLAQHMGPHLQNAPLSPPDPIGTSLISS